MGLGLQKSLLHSDRTSDRVLRLTPSLRQTRPLPQRLVTLLHLLRIHAHQPRVNRPLARRSYSALAPQDRQSVSTRREFPLRRFGRPRRSPQHAVGDFLALLDRSIRQVDVNGISRMINSHTHGLVLSMYAQSRPCRPGVDNGRFLRDLDGGLVQAYPAFGGGDGFCDLVRIFLTCANRPDAASRITNRPARTSRVPCAAFRAARFSASCTTAASMILPISYPMPLRPRGDRSSRRHCWWRRLRPRCHPGQARAEATVEG